jgi:hypothetical protein
MFDCVHGIKGPGINGCILADVSRGSGAVGGCRASVVGRQRATTSPGYLTAKSRHPPSLTASLPPARRTWASARRCRLEARAVGPGDAKRTAASQRTVAAAAERPHRDTASPLPPAAPPPFPPFAHTTTQSISLLLTVLRQGPRGVRTARRAIVVCPTSLVANWVRGRDRPADGGWGRSHCWRRALTLLHRCACSPTLADAPPPTTPTTLYLHLRRRRRSRSGWATGSRPWRWRRRRATRRRRTSAPSCRPPTPRTC